MNTRITRFLLGTIIASAIAVLLLIQPLPKVARAEAPLPFSGVDVWVDTTYDGYYLYLCSLRAAIQTLNNGADQYGCTPTYNGTAFNNVWLPEGTYTLTMPGSGEDFDETGDLDIRTSMNISAINISPVIVTGDVSWTDRIFHILTGTVTINGLTIRKGREDINGGGAIRIESGQSLSLNDSGIANSSAVGMGGGIYNSGTATLTNVTVISNTADYGGGIYNSGTATLSNVTVISNTADTAGGGIYSSGAATLSNATVVSNTADYAGGGIINGGMATLTNVTVLSNTANYAGGGVYNYTGTATLTNVTLSDNSAFCLTLTSNYSCGRGGGIVNNATLTLTNVTLSGNSATCFAYGDGFCSGSGGGIANGEDGGGGGTTTLTNVTFSNNSAICNWLCAGRGGGIVNNATLTLTNVTLSGNSAFNSGGGIFNSGGYVTGSMWVMNTIVANSPSGGNCSNVWLLGGSSNLSSDNTCGFGASWDNVNVMLGPLANNGGATQTHALLPGSPAINAGGNVGCPATDQRGVTRQRTVQNPCDIGAFENSYLFLPLIKK